jgi:hypothetical protein
VCGVNHFSATNTKVGKQYSKGMDKEQIALLKKDSHRKRAHSKDSAHLKGFGQKGSGNILGSRKMGNSEKTKKTIPQRSANAAPSRIQSKIETETLESLITTATRRGIALEEILGSLNIQLQDQNNGELTATLTQS